MRWSPRARRPMRCVPAYPHSPKSCARSGQRWCAWAKRRAHMCLMRQWMRRRTRSRLSKRCAGATCPPHMAVAHAAATPALGKTLGSAVQARARRGQPSSTDARGPPAHAGAHAHTGSDPRSREAHDRLGMRMHMHAPACMRAHVHTGIRACTCAGARADTCACLQMHVELCRRRWRASTHGCARRLQRRRMWP